MQIVIVLFIIFIVDWVVHKNSYISFETKLEEKIGRYLRFDREHNWIEVFVFNFPAKLFVLRLKHQ